MKKMLSLMNAGNAGTGFWGSGKENIQWPKIVMYFAILFVPLLNIYGTAPFTHSMYFIVGMASIIAGALYCVRNSIIRTVPISYKKRVLYYYLSTILWILIVMAVMFVIGLLIMCIIALCNWAANGTNIFIDTDEEDAVELSVNAYLYSAFALLFFYGVLMGVSRIERTRNSVIAYLITILVLFGGNMLLANLVDDGTSRFVISAPIYEQFETLPVPWLAVLLCGLFAAAALIGSVIFLIYKEKPKKF